MTDETSPSHDAIEAEFVVYGGNGHRRLWSFTTRERAEKYAAEFDQTCWSLGVAVPRSTIEERK